MTTFVQEYIFSGIIQEIENKMSRAGYGIQIEVAVQPQAHGLFFDVHSQSGVWQSLRPALCEYLPARPNSVGAYRSPRRAE